MLIDTNTYLGHWAFRPLPWHTAEDLLRAMDAHEIDQAFVSSASAILYRNSQAGNEELFSQVRAHLGSLDPVGRGLLRWDQVVVKDRIQAGDDFTIVVYTIPQ